MFVELKIRFHESILLFIIIQRGMRVGQAKNWIATLINDSGMFRLVVQGQSPRAVLPIKPPLDGYNTAHGE